MVFRDDCLECSFISIIWPLRGCQYFFLDTLFRILLLLYMGLKIEIPCWSQRSSKETIAILLNYLLLFILPNDLFFVDLINTQILELFQYGSLILNYSTWLNHLPYSFFWIELNILFIKHNQESSWSSLYLMVSKRIIVI